MKDTLLGAAQVMSIIVAPILGSEAARGLRSINLADDSFLNISEYVPRWLFDGTVIGSFTLSSYFFVEWMEGLKEGDVTLDVNTQGISLQEDPSPSDFRRWAEHREEDKEELKDLRIKTREMKEEMKKGEEQIADVVTDICESSIEITICEDGEGEVMLTEAVSELLKKAEAMKEDLDELPEHVEILEDGLKVTRNGDSVSQEWEELMDTAMASIEANYVHKKNFEDISSSDHKVDTAAAVAKGLALTNPERLEEYLDPDESRKGVESALEEAETSIEDAIKS